METGRPDQHLSLNHPELDMLQRFRGKPFAVQLFGGDIHTGRLLGVWLDAHGRMIAAAPQAARRGHSQLPRCEAVVRDDSTGDVPYPSVEDCKQAIDRYILERNQHFRHQPQKAGKKIWGKERVPAESNPANNCKDPPGVVALDNNPVLGVLARPRWTQNGWHDSPGGCAAPKIVRLPLRCNRFPVFPGALDWHTANPALSQRPHGHSDGQPTALADFRFGLKGPSSHRGTLATTPVLVRNANQVHKLVNV